MASVRRNETIELTFEAEVQVSNPMREFELNVTFRESGGASVSLPGFWDGGTTWKARFAWPEDSTVAVDHVLQSGAHRPPRPNRDVLDFGDG